MRLDVTNVPDFIKYYGEAYVRSKTKQGLIYYVGPRGGGLGKVALYPTNDDGRIASDKMIALHFEELEKEIFFGLPPLGMVVYENMLIYIAQNFKRSGARGLSRYRGHMYVLSNDSSLYRDYVGKHGLVSLSQALNDARFAREVLWPHYTSDIQKGMEEMLNGEVAALAFNRDFGVYLTDNYKHPIFCYKTTPIGEIPAKDKIVLSGSASGYVPLVNELVYGNSMEVICKTKATA